MFWSFIPWSGNVYCSWINNTCDYLCWHVYIYIYIYIYIHWLSKRIDHTEAKDGDVINIVTNLIMTSNYTKNKQKTNLNI